MGSKNRYLIEALASILGVTVTNLWFEIDIGAGGLGGAAVLTDNTSGAIGGNGGLTRMRIRTFINSNNITIMQAGQGFGGQPGGTGGTASGAVSNTYPGRLIGSGGGFGANGNAGNGTGSNSAPSSGGGGAGQTGALAARNGGFGGAPSGDIYGLLVAQAAPGQNAPTNLPPGMPGGGGGGANAPITGIGQNGGNGFRGGGGGGGSGGINGSPSGKGGNGGNGYAYLLWS
jgi:hypothetical protein